MSKDSAFKDSAFKDSAFKDSVSKGSGREVGNETIFRGRIGS